MMSIYFLKCVFVENNVFEFLLFFFIIIGKWQLCEPKGLIFLNHTYASKHYGLLSIYIAYFCVFTVSHELLVIHALISLG